MARHSLLLSWGARIDVTTGLGYPKKADDARRNPLVAMLFSDPTGSGPTGSPMVLVSSRLATLRANAAKARRFRRTAKRELRRRH